MFRKACFLNVNCISLSNSEYPVKATDKVGEGSWPQLGPDAKASSTGNPLPPQPGQLGVWIYDPYDSLGWPQLGPEATASGTGNPLPPQPSQLRVGTCVDLRPSSFVLGQRLQRWTRVSCPPYRLGVGTCVDLRPSLLVLGQRFQRWKPSSSPPSQLGVGICVDL